MISCKLYQGDCLEVMKNIPKNSVDCIITSPPYDDLRDYNSTINYETLIHLFYNALNNGGIVVWNVDDRISTGSKTLSSFKQALLFKEIGFNVNDIIIWKKTNPIPQLKRSHYQHSYEFMFVFSKGFPKTFNPILVNCSCAGKQLSSGKVASKNKKRKSKSITVNEQKIASDIWEFPICHNDTNHPAVFPLELPLLHIKSWTNENDTVLDPFMGSGTTGIACKMLNRNFIGIELDENYFKTAKERIERYSVNKKLF